MPAVVVAGQPGADHLPAVAAAHAAGVLLLHKLVAVGVLLALIHAACTQEHTADRSRQREETRLLGRAGKTYWEMNHLQFCRFA